jgi:hypothetical protein
VAQLDDVRRRYPSVIAQVRPGPVDKLTYAPRRRGTTPKSSAVTTTRPLPRPGTAPHKPAPTLSFPGTRLTRGGGLPRRCLVTVAAATRRQRH